MYGFLNKIIYEWIGLCNNDVADLMPHESQTTADLNNVVDTGNQTFFKKKTKKIIITFFLIFKSKFPRIQTCLLHPKEHSAIWNVTDTDAVGSEPFKSAFQACCAW